MLTVVREFIEAAMSRSALDRMLRRHGVSRLPKETGAEPRTSTPFKAYEPGFVPIGIKYLPQMRTGGATPSWPSTAPRAGSMCS